MAMPLTAPGHVAGFGCRGSCDRMAHASTSCTLFSKPAPFQSRSLSASQNPHRSLLREQRRGQVLVRSFDVDAEEEEANPRQRRGRRERPQEKTIGDDEVERDADGFEERVLQVSRVTKVVKGGKQMSFRAVVAVGDDKGQVGVGCSAAKEVITAVEKAVIDAKRHLIRVPITRGKSFPHRVNGNAGGAKVMLRPATEGTGVIAGGAVRTVLELSGIKNGFGKQLGSANPLNNARATVEGLSQLRTLQQVADERHLTVGEMLAFKPAPKEDKTLVAA